jgi:hypothetical protein
MCINVYEYAKGPSRNVASASVSVVEPIMDAVMVPTFTLFPELDIFGGMEFDSGLDIPVSTYNPNSPSKDEWTTTTTTVITPGIDTTEQAMAIKEVADNLLGATGAVLGVTAAVMAGQWRSVYAGAVYGDMAGRWVGAGMWNLIN